MAIYAGHSSKKTIKEQIADDIFQDVIRGVYPPGTILNEGTLVEKYNVSKSPVREALITLCSSDVLTNIPRVGYQVVPISPQQFRDMQELRLLIEESALRKSIAIMTPQQADALLDEFQQGEPLTDEKDILDNWNHNIRFHLMLCRQCGNQYLYKTLEGILHFFSRAAMQYYTNSWEQGKRTDSSAHRRILQAVQEKDTETAVALLLRDIGCMEEDFLYR